AYRDRSRTLSGVLAHANPIDTTLGGDAPQQFYGQLVSCNYFAVLQQPPALGRALAAQDCEPGADPIVVLGHKLWTTTFAADPKIIGRTVELNRQLFTVIGVAAEGTYGAMPYKSGYFAPLSTEPLLEPNRHHYEDDGYRWLYLIGRRSDRAGLEQVRAELDVIAAQIDRQQPGRSTTLNVERATPMTIPPFLRGPATGAGAVLMAAFGLILLIACANVANLLLARGTAKSREIGIRLSLGASRGRVIRELLIESLLISLAGGLLGSMLALWSFQALVALVLPSLVPPGIPAFQWNLSPDFRVLSFALALTLGTGILFGLAPALHVTKPDLLEVLKQDSAGAGSSRASGRLRGTLVGVQVALCMTLTVATGLLMRGLYVTYTLDPGFDYRDVAYVSLQLRDAGYDAHETQVLQQRLMEKVKALPGVKAAAYAQQDPLGESSWRTGIRLPGQSESEFRTAELNAVTLNYFSLLGIPIVRGRTFTETEITNADPKAAIRPAIISERTARNLWPERDPIGQTLLMSKDSRLRVVGVAGDAQVSALGDIDPYYVYLPAATAQVLLVKSRVDLSAVASSIRASVHALDPALVVSVRPLKANIAWWRGVSGIVTSLGAGLGTLALLLASVGIYGVVSYAITMRYREFGIRMALGADARDVLGMILRQTLRPVTVGAVIGIAAASALSHVLPSVLFGVSAADPIGLGGAALLVLGVAFAASFLAARPAARTDPSATLRSE
ncbi:MAG TPA: ADOP family duplicated permease, partial [Gammaproteobacteria bacterium]|nr:ADOP family duplicated permease [Gammaproteobacteria bacterium]